MHRDVVWEWIRYPGLEHLSLDIGGDGITADGVIVADFGARPIRVHYAVRCDGAWRVRRAAVTADDGGTRRSAELARDAGGNWTVNGARRPDLDGCTDIDIMATPFTNTLPIRNLGLAPDERRQIRVVYVKLPELTLSAADQEYTRLDSAEPPRRFRYRGLDTGFVADLTVDADGLVVDYPGIWRRRGG
ncbi:MAG TPA: putative glycolipid-binding domain-containing protein [Alphaproteobacteria bacterium]